jgi:pimeloyl-ACP methyl ester carboxylesterase
MVGHYDGMPLCRIPVRRSRSGAVSISRHELWRWRSKGRRRANVILSAIELGDRNGPPVLALHGADATREAWTRIATEGLPGRRWICPDARCHGDSPDGPMSFEQMAQDALETITQLGVERFDLIGHSMGAIIVPQLCALAPSRVRSAIMLDPPLKETPEELVKWFESMTADPAVSEEVVEEFPTVAESLSARLKVTAAVDTLPVEAMTHALAEESARLEQLENGRFTVRARANFEELFQTKSTLTFGEFQGDVLLAICTKGYLRGRFHAVSTEGLNVLELQLGDRLKTEKINSGHELLLEAFDETVSVIARFFDRQDG